MRRTTFALLLLGTLLAGQMAADEALAQFSPGGRRKPKPATGVPAARPAGGGQPAAAVPAPTAASAPSDAALIARYTGIVLAQPGASFPLQRLADLYRQRDGKLDALVADFERRAEDPGAQRWSALVALAGIYHRAGDPQRAIATYERAIAEQPQSPVARLALAELLVDRGDRAGARTQYEAALPLLKADAEREQVLRQLMTLCLDLKDVAGARRHHEELVKRAQGSFYVRGELARELFVRGDYAAATVEHQRVVDAAAGDNRVLGPALRDLGHAQAKAGDPTTALKTLRQALRVAGAQAGIRREIYEIIVELYRAQDRLRELIVELEHQRNADAQELRMLARLYEETGQVQRALDTYRQALTKDGRDLEMRLKVVQLLQIQGELDAAITEYEALIRAAPHNPDFVFQLAEALIQRGDRSQAMRRLAELEARSANDEETLAALVDYYERMEEKARALAMLQRLTALGAQDPRHFVDLGDRYWQDGDKEKAQRTWQRILTLGTNRADALMTLGEVYLEHGLAEEGLNALAEAAKIGGPSQKYQKAHALALERTGSSANGERGRRKQYDRALEIWERLLAEPASDPQLAREARQHIVTLWSLMGTLDRREVPLARRLGASPPDLEAGRLLAEAQLRRKRYPAAQTTLETITRHAPGDVASLASLERVLVLQRQLRAAIGVLTRLVEADPKRARDYYQRMAQYAAELYADDEAVTYAARAVELSPDDAEGHRRLGDMYRRRQQSGQAIAQYRQAIMKNDRLFPVYFDLCDLLLGDGEIEEADRLLRRVVRSAPDDELVTRAARMSMQIHLGRGDLEVLERELLPVALGNPQKPLYRRLLVELYGAMALPLVHRSQSEDPAEAAEARSALVRIGERAVKPLLDALGDEREEQQRVAIGLLAHIRNRGAGPALFAFATGTAAPDLRTRAMIAVGMLRDPALVPRLEGFLVIRGKARADEADPVVVAAAWSVARLRDARARRLLLTLLDSDAPSLRAMGAVGLGLLGDQRSRELLVKVARAPEWGPLPRAAAADALGRLGGGSSTVPLAELAVAADPTVRGTAVIALARVRAPDAERMVADALVAVDPEVQRAAAAAAAALATGEIREPAEPLSAGEGSIDVRRCLESLRPTDYSLAERVAALARLRAPLAQAAAAAAVSSPDRARVIADAIRPVGDHAGFLPLTGDLTGATAAELATAAAVAGEVARAVVPAFVALSGHPAPEVRARALALLARRDEPEARTVIANALTDPALPVRRAALAAVATRRDRTTAEAVAKVLLEPGDWPVRVWAADALAKVGPTAATPAVTRALVRATLEDDTALVREAALRALVAVDRAGAGAVLRQVERDDPEPRLRAAAKQELAR
ncbi:MAG: tetratricopeptide repeat protein [Polyangiaceae bacterium]|nr:tetratricopeptide repeat protein [Polyangiaceae bacterium]